MNGQQVVVAHPKTREVIELGTASDQELAAIRVACEEVALELKRADELLGQEVLTRMDRSAEWTRRVRIGENEYVFTAPSPNAGTTEYDPDILEIALSELVDSHVIDAETAAKALVREVTVTLAVPWGEPLDEFTEAAHDLANAVKAAASVKVNLPTINRLLKVEEVAGAVKAAQEKKPQTDRKVKFAVKA